MIYRINTSDVSHWLGICLLCTTQSQQPGGKAECINVCSCFSHLLSLFHLLTKSQMWIFSLALPPLGNYLMPP